MTRGKEILSKLINKLDVQENVSSSHWDKYHLNFRYEFESLKGVQGFGHLNKNYGFISNFIQNIFQKKYRKMSSQTPLFKKIDASAFNFSKVQ